MARRDFPARLFAGEAVVGDEGFGVGSWCVRTIALEQKYRVEGLFRMQQLHDELASTEVTAAEKYDPARAIQRQYLRRIFHGLGSLATVVKHDRHMLCYEPSPIQ